MIQLNDLVYFKLDDNVHFGQVIAIDDFNFVVYCRFTNGEWEDYMLSFEQNEYIKAGKYVKEKTKRHWWSKETYEWVPKFDYEEIENI